MVVHISRGGEMNLPIIVKVLTRQIDGLCPHTTLLCPLKTGMDQHKETSALLTACGHTTEELDSAIVTADKAIENLKAARERAVAWFKA
jgi:hypothetical protein